MSYKVWSVNGYGIRTDLIQTDKEHLVRFIQNAPVFAKYFTEWLSDTGDDLDGVTLETMVAFEDEYGNRGIAPIMAAVIYELENIELSVTQDICGCYYLLLEPAYPWSRLTKEESSLTKETAFNLFVQYTEMLTVQEIFPDYESAECGG